MSERVERELKEWKERYEIPYHMEFQVKTLLGLQEEYENILPAENNTKRRELLLQMINDLLNKIPLKQRDRKYFEVKNKLDSVWIKFDDIEKDKIKIQFDDMIKKMTYKELPQYR